MDILYGVLGEGMGHAIRSYVIIKHLMKKHRVQVVTSNRAYKFFAKHIPKNVNEIKGFNLVYNDGALSMPRTMVSVLKFMVKAPIPNIKRYFEISKKFEGIEFNPKIVISDFESFSFIYSKIHDIPLISLDNMQILSRCRLGFDIPLKEFYNYFMAKKIVQIKVLHCNQYIITTFFTLPVIKRDTNFVPPILRDEILNAKPGEGSHILVYQTSSTKKDLLDILQGVPGEIFYVYGHSSSAVEGNVIFKDFSEEEFIRDLADSKAVLTNGGFTLITEALYLKKPICSAPVKNQFEQYVNAFYLEKMGYGKHLEEFSPEKIKEFISDLDRYKSELQEYSQIGNEESLKMIDSLIDRLT